MDKYAIALKNFQASMYALMRECENLKKSDDDTLLEEQMPSQLLEFLEEYVQERIDSRISALENRV